jgi:hypothetical protein
VTIEPDTKDWTWVLDRRCDECGFDASTLAATEVAGLIRENAASWRELLDRPGVTERPSPDRWSALEYACHVRDVYRIYDERLALMLAEDDPSFPNWDQDAAAVDDRYNEQDPADVVAGIEAAGAALADRFDGVPDGGWARTGARSDGAHFTIDTFARYLIHDPVHHVHDVRHGFAALDR